MHRKTLQLAIGRAPGRLAPAVVALGMMAPCAWAQHAGGSSLSNAGSGDALIKGHNEQGRKTGPGWRVVDGSGTGSGGDVLGDDDSKITSGGGNGAGDGDDLTRMIDGVDQFLDDLGDAPPGEDRFFMPPGGRGDAGMRLIEPASGSTRDPGGPVINTGGNGGAVPAPGTVALVVLGWAAAGRRRSR